MTAAVARHAIRHAIPRLFAIADNLDADTAELLRAVIADLREGLDG